MGANASVRCCLQNAAVAHARMMLNQNVGRFVGVRLSGGRGGAGVLWSSLSHHHSDTLCVEWRLCWLQTGGGLGVSIRPGLGTEMIGR